MPTNNPDPAAVTPESAKRDSAEWGAGVLKAIGAMALIFPLAWAAYTYYHQEVQQRRQGFLQAYDIVHGRLGTEIVTSIDKAISAIYWSEDVDFANARQRADEATTEADRAPAIAAMQHWIVHNILVKDKNAVHDRQNQNYQQALRNLFFYMNTQRPMPALR